MAPSKPVGTWTYEDLCGLPDDGRRWEIIDGELYEMPAPDPRQARVIIRLLRVLSRLIPADVAELMTAPVDVFFPGADPVELDTIALLPERLGLISQRGVEGPPDLVVEVLGPSNPRHDTVRKRGPYARGGVPEFWLVDPEARTVEVLVLAGGAYRTHASAAGDDMVTSPVLPEVAFAASEVFEGIPFG